MIIINLKLRQYFAFALGFPLIALILNSCGTGRNAVSRGHTTNAGIAHSGATSSNKAPIYSLSGDTKALVNEAYSWLGTKYVYGGHSRTGTDCSGMIMEIYLKILGLKLPRASYQQQEYCDKIEKATLKPGDLVFFSSKPGAKVSHVGLYIGNGEMIHASASQGVMVSNIYDNYFTRHYHSSGHIPYLNNYMLTDIKPTTEQVQSNNIDESVKHILDLDEVLTAKTDSILSNYMD